MYAQKAIVHNAPTLHTVRNVHNAHCAYRFKVQLCDCINFVRATESICSIWARSRSSCRRTTLPCLAHRRMQRFGKPRCHFERLGI